MTIIEDFDYINKKLKLLEKEAEAQKSQELAQETVQQTLQQNQDKAEKKGLVVGNWKGSVAGSCNNQSNLQNQNIDGIALYSQAHPCIGMVDGVDLEQLSQRLKEAEDRFYKAYHELYSSGLYGGE